MAAQRGRCDGGDGYACRWLARQLGRQQPPAAKAAKEMRSRALAGWIAACNQDGDPDACMAGAELCGKACTSGGKRYGAAGLRKLALRRLIRLCTAGDGYRCNQAGLEIAERGGQGADGRALPWFRRACLEGWVDACDSAALRTKPGKPGHVDRVAIYGKACLLGSESACAQLGEEVRPELDAGRDAEEAGDQADEDEEPPALIALRKEALAVMVRACQRGDWEICMKAVAELEQAEAIAAARPLLELACDKGLGSACQELAYWHQVMIRHDDPGELASATLAAYTRACLAGLLSACEEAEAWARTPAQRATLRPTALRTALAICQDDASARRSVDRAQEQGAACTLAAVLVRQAPDATQGLSGHQQLAERALALARRRCVGKTACPEAAERLGDRRLSVYDPVRAAELRAAACGNGYPGQCVLLAHQYEQGEGVGKDPKRARELLASSCAKLNRDACSEMARHGWRLPSTKLAGKPDPASGRQLPEPAERLALPLKVPGCPGEYCACIVSRRLVAGTTLLEAPEEGAAKLLDVASGTLIAHAAIFEMIDRPGVARLGGACDESKPDKPGPPVYYLGYAGEGAHMVWLDGRRREVDDCEITQLLAKPEAAIWVEITTHSGKTGYTQDMGVVERGAPDAKRSCLY